MWVILLLVVVVGLGGAVGYVKFLGPALARDRKLTADGADGIGWVVSAAPHLGQRSEGENDHSGAVGVLIPTAPRDASDVDFMSDLIGRCQALAAAPKHADPDLRRFQKALKKDVVEDGVWEEVPAAWNDGAPIHYTLMIAWRSKLPKGRLKWRYLRLRYVPDEPEAGVRHEAYHPDDEDDRPDIRRRRAAADE